MTKASQTILFGLRPPRTFGDQPFAISAAASSGLPVGFTAAGPCIIAGSLVTLTAAGNCLITGTQPGDPVYDPALPVQQSFTIAVAGPMSTPEPGTPTAVLPRVYLPVSTQRYAGGW